MTKEIHLVRIYAIFHLWGSGQTYNDRIGLLANVFDSLAGPEIVNKTQIYEFFTQKGKASAEIQKHVVLRLRMTQTQGAL